ALLRYEGQGFIKDPAARMRLEDALTAWAMAGFHARLEAPGQRVSMQQMLADIGPRSVVGLPGLIQPDAPQVDQGVRIGAEVGDDATKQRAAHNLIAVTRHAASAAWRQARSDELKKQDAKAFERVGDAAIQKHLLQLQEDEVLKLQGSIKRLGQAASRAFLA